MATSLLAITGWTDRMKGDAGGVAGITAPLGDRLVIRLDEPFEPLLDALADPSLGIVIQGQDGQRQDGLVGTGRYRLDDATGDLVAVDQLVPIGRIELVDVAGVSGAELLAEGRGDWAVLSHESSIDTLPGDIVRVPLDMSVGIAIRLDTAAERRVLGDEFNTIALAQAADLAISPPSLADGDRDELPERLTVDAPEGPLEAIAYLMVEQLLAVGVSAEIRVSDPAEFARLVASGDAEVFPFVIADGAWTGSGYASILMPEFVDDVFGVASEDRTSAVQILMAEPDADARDRFLDETIQVAVDEGILVLVGRFEARVGVGPAAQGIVHGPDGTLDLTALAVG